MHLQQEPGQVIGWRPPQAVTPEGADAPCADPRPSCMCYRCWWCCWCCSAPLVGGVSSNTLRRMIPSSRPSSSPDQDLAKDIGWKFRPLSGFCLNRSADSIFLSRYCVLPCEANTEFRATAGWRCSAPHNSSSGLDAADQRVFKWLFVAGSATLVFAAKR